LKETASPLPTVAGPVACKSPTGHSFCTYSVIFQKHAQDTFSHVPTSLTNCFAQYEQRTLYGALVLVLLPRLINCRFTIVTITVIIIECAVRCGDQYIY